MHLHKNADSWKKTLVGHRVLILFQTAYLTCMVLLPWIKLMMPWPEISTRFTTVARLLGPTMSLHGICPDKYYVGTVTVKLCYHNSWKLSELSHICSEAVSTKWSGALY